MIKHYIDRVVKHIDSLIELTEDDIEDIKNAKNDSIFARTKIKDEIIGLFENEKALLDGELLKLAKSNPGCDISDILGDIEKGRLETLRDRLSKLHRVNKKYAKLVVAVNEFYTKLFDQIFPTEMENYKKINPKSFSLLKVSA